MSPLSVGICLYILQTYLCIFLLTTGGSSASATLVRKRKNIHHLHLGQSGDRTLGILSGDWRHLGDSLMTADCFCLFRTIFKCFLNVREVMSLQWAGLRGWAGFWISCLFITLQCIFIFSTLVSYDGLLRKSGFTWTSGRGWGLWAGGVEGEVSIVWVE